MRLKVSFLLFMLCISLCAGCSREKEEVVVHVPAADGSINYQTSTYCFTKEELIPDYFYVKHNDLYYPLLSSENNYEDEYPAENVDPYRFTYQDTANEIDIPTLFLENGDTLIYYSQNALLDYIVWERYEDRGYSVGFQNIDTMTSGRCYITLDEETTNIHPNSELIMLYDAAAPYGATFVYLDRIGGVTLTKDLLRDGIIQGLTRGMEYDLECYFGTNYHHMRTTANLHTWAAMELFASIEYTPIEGTIYEITIPDYFKTGYYMVSGNAFLRLVRESSYSDTTNYNEPILITDNRYPGMYSTYEPLNKYYTEVEGSVGYIEGMELANPTPGPVELPKEEPNQFQSAKVKEVIVYFPSYMETSIIEVLTSENTGDIVIEIGGQEYPFEKSENGYSLSFGQGNDSYGILTISGLLNEYKLTMFGCYEDELPEDMHENEGLLEDDADDFAQPDNTSDRRGGR